MTQLKTWDRLGYKRHFTRCLQVSLQESKNKLKRGLSGWPLNALKEHLGGRGVGAMPLLLSLQPLKSSQLLFRSLQGVCECKTSSLCRIYEPYFWNAKNVLEIISAKCRTPLIPWLYQSAVICVPLSGWFVSVFLSRVLCVSRQYFSAKFARPLFSDRFTLRLLLTRYFALYSALRAPTGPRRGALCPLSSAHCRAN